MLVKYLLIYQRKLMPRILLIERTYLVHVAYFKIRQVVPKNFRCRSKVIASNVSLTFGSYHQVSADTNISVQSSATENICDCNSNIGEPENVFVLKPESKTISKQRKHLSSRFDIIVPPTKCTFHFILIIILDSPMISTTIRELTYLPLSKQLTFNRTNTNIFISLKNTQQTLRKMSKISASS